MDTVATRLSRYLEYRSLTAKDFERTTDLGNGTCAAIGERTRKTTFDRISKNNLDLNIVWLRTGEGEMLKDLGELTDEPETKVLHARESYKRVPLINIDSVGGVHSLNMIDSSEEYPIRLLPFTDAREGNVAIIQTGNSMSPTIPPGSVLLIRKVEDWQEYFGYGNIYVLWLRDNRRTSLVMRRYDSDPKNYVWCVSYNPDVADEELPRNLIRGVWKVIKYQANFG